MQLRPLRFIVCGTAGTGKSTLIGQFLSEQNFISGDHFANLSCKSEKIGPIEADFDFASHLNGLAAERERGIVGDIVWRSFTTKRRAFSVADVSEDEQYSRNLVVGASKADLAVLAVDAHKGLLDQSRCDAVIANLLGIRHCVLAVNNINLINFDQSIFEKISEDFFHFAAGLNFTEIRAIPITDRNGDNILIPSEGTPWFQGPQLLDYLESVDLGDRHLSAVRTQTADQFASHLIWLSRENLMPGRSYLMKINDTSVAATITDLKHKLDIGTLSKFAAKTLGFNEIGACNLSLARPISFDSHADNRATGAFNLIHRYTNEPVAVGVIDFALRRATNIQHQKLAVSKAQRTRLMQHKPGVLWFTGLSGAGKSTIANLVEVSLHQRGVHTILLDGDNVRHGLNKDLGFTEFDRVENIRRVGEVAKLMTEAGLIVLCAFISPFRAERHLVRELVGDDFIEVFVDTPIEQCIARDPKGLYKRALAGEIKNFTGVDQAYEMPENAELHLKTGRDSAHALAEDVINELVRRKIF